MIVAQMCCQVNIYIMVAHIEQEAFTFVNPLSDELAIVLPVLSNRSSRLETPRAEG
jgi:hypothetical protein